MPDPNDELFAEVAARQQEDTPEHEIARQAAYEAKVVKRILTEAGFKPSKWSGVVSQSREFTGAEHLSFAWFTEMYPTFPVILMTEKIRWMHRTKWSDFFKRFTKTTLYHKFSELAAQREIDPAKTYVGLVFEFGDLGTMVLHNYPRHPQEVLGEGKYDEGARLVRPLKNVVYVIEQVSSFISAVGTSWVP